MNSRFLDILIGIMILSVIGSVAYSATNITTNSTVNVTSNITPTKVAVVVSASSGVWSNQSVLESAYQAVNCRTVFAASMVNQSISTDSGLSASLNTYMSALTQDDATLKADVTSDTLRNFAVFVYGTYDPDLLSLYVNGRAAIVNDHNMTLRQKLALGSYFSSLVPTYENCVTLPLENLSSAKLAFYNASVVHFNAQISNLSANGVNTTNMSIILQGGESQIIQPFQQSIQGNTNPTGLWNALNQYCLYDGCPLGTNYHLDAKINIAKLYALTAKLRTVSNDTVDLNNSQSSLNLASSELANVGTSQYSANQAVQIWTNINASVVSLHSAFNKLNG